MSAESELLDAYGEWHRLAEAETKAIQTRNWDLLSDCHLVIKDLQALGFADGQIVSTLERYMKCGVGKCGHCCIGVAYVCTDGPVFTYEQIKKLGEDI